MMVSNVRLRRGEADVVIRAFSAFASRGSTLLKRSVRGVRRCGEVVFHRCYFRFATAGHGVNAYGSLCSVPEGVPAGVMVVLALLVVVLGRSGAAASRP